MDYMVVCWNLCKDLLFIRYSNVNLLRSRFAELNSDQKEAKFGDKNGDKKICDKIKDSILKVIEQWINLHPEDWTQIKNKKCRQLIRHSFKKYCESDCIRCHQFWLGYILKAHTKKNFGFLQRRKAICIIVGIVGERKSKNG